MVLICIPDGSVDSYGPPGKKASAPAVTEKNKKSAAKKEVKVEKASSVRGDKAGDLDAAITAQGDVVRKLKADKAEKTVVNENVNKLLGKKYFIDEKATFDLLSSEERVQRGNRQGMEARSSGISCSSYLSSSIIFWIWRHQCGNSSSGRCCQEVES